MGRRLLTIVTIALFISASIGSGVASALPDNKNTGSETATCAAPLGVVTVRFNERSDSSTAWLPNGSIVVVKKFVGTETITVSIAGTLGPLTDSESFTQDRGTNGVAASRLLRCTGSETFGPFTVALDADEAEHLAEHFPTVNWTQYVGRQVTMSGTFRFEAWVMRPGAR